MSGEAAALDFLEALRGDSPAPESTSRPARLGTIAAGYSGSGSAGVVFDGEASAGARTYVTLAPVRAGQRVVLIPVGHTYVVLGPVTGGAPGGDLPPGTSLEGHWTAAPSGFLLEDGAVVLRATYPELFAVLGTRYNTGGETSLQFRLPDSRGRVAVPRAAAGTFATLGARVGAESTSIPAHTHNLSDAGYAKIDHRADANLNTRRIATPSWAGTARSGLNAYAVDSSNRTVGAGLGGATDSGGAATPSVVQPSIVVTRVIKT